MCSRVPFWLLMLCVIFCLAGNAFALRDSTTDLWDVSHGVVIDGDSGILSLTDVTRMFGTGCDTLFADGQAPGTLHYVEWHTPHPIFLRSFNLHAAHDGADRNIYYRGFSKFTLYYGDGQGHWTQLYEYETDPDKDSLYGGGATYTDRQNLELHVDVTPTLAKYFRAEFVQSGGPPIGAANASGPRIIELDGYDTFTYAPNPAADPSAPELTVTTNGLNVTLSWSAVADASGYILWFVFPNDQFQLDFSTLGFIDMGNTRSITGALSSGMAFYTAIQSYHASGSGGISNIELVSIFGGDLTFPDTGNNLLEINDPGGIGTVLFQGTSTPSGPGLPATGLSVNDGDTQFTVSWDTEGRPTELNMEEMQIRYRYNNDGSFNYVVFENGQGIYLGKGIQSNEDWPCDDREGYERHIAQTDPVIQKLVQEIAKLRTTLYCVFVFSNPDFPMGPKLTGAEEFRFQLALYQIRKTFDITLKSLEDYLAKEMDRFDNRCQGCPSDRPIDCGGGGCCPAVWPKCCPATKWCCPSNTTCCPNGPGCYLPGEICCWDGTTCPADYPICGDDGYCYTSQNGAKSLSRKTPAGMTGGRCPAHQSGGTSLIRSYQKSKTSETALPSTTH